MLWTKVARGMRRCALASPIVLRSSRVPKNSPLIAGSEGLKLKPDRLQTRWRGYKAKSGYKKLQRGVLVAQCLYRGRLAKRELRKLKLVSCFWLLCCSLASKPSALAFAAIVWYLGFLPMACLRNQIFSFRALTTLTAQLTISK